MLLWKLDFGFTSVGFAGEAGKKREGDEDGSDGDGEPAVREGDCESVRSERVNVFAVRG